MLDSDSMPGRVCVVTGSTSGVGKETALGLARRGATVLAVARDAARGEEAVAELRARSGNPAVELLLADLASQASVRRLASEIRARHAAVHVLVNNAGAVFPTRLVTADGLELTVALNHLAYFLLAVLLLDALRAGAPSRVINVTSDAHRAVTLDLDDLQMDRGYHGLRQYSRSKLMNLLFTYELARRLDGTGVTVNAVHPGMVASNFARDHGGALGLFYRVARPFMASAEQGADTVLWAATAPELEGVTGRYFVKRRPRRSSAASYDVQAAARLWAVSERLAPPSG